jgi:LacI family transcriptional regulator
MKKIMIIIDTSRASGRKFLSGAEKYISTLTDMEVYIKPPDYLIQESLDFNLSFPFDKFDGLLIRDAVNTVRIMNVNIPKVINDTHRELIPDTSTIITDSKKIGQVAAEYLLGLGFRYFAYCGYQDFAWSKKRYDAFSDILKDNDIETFFNLENEVSGQQKNNMERWKIAEWLKQLPRPVCIFACNDDRAISVLEACKIAGLSVPEEVAVLGVDNDELMCNLSSPSLSSIELDFEGAGFTAAQHLNELIHKKTEHKIIYVPPVEIVKRRSTDILAINDQNVASALIFIRNNYYKPIQVVDVVDATCLSKRELEKRFKNILKRTIKSEIKRLRLDLIKKKLLSSNDPVYQIANELEFTDPEHFSRYFKNATGLSPIEFKRTVSVPPSEKNNTV